MKSLVVTLLLPVFMIAWMMRAFFLLAALGCAGCVLVLHQGLWQGVVFFVVAWACTAVMRVVSHATAMV